jgi:DNA-binding NtrC family response regulator
MSENPHILIVDDEPNLRLVFRTVLESADYTLSTADDGETALKWLQSHAAELVLLDLQMPRVGGLKVLETLREAGNDVPVVIITAYGSVPNAVEAMKLGAIDFLAKPLAPDTLRKVVADVLHRNTPRKPKPQTPPPVTAQSQFVENLTLAKRALNRRAFQEADVYLKQAIGLDADSAEAHNLMGVLHEMRNERDESYHEFKAALRADRHYEPAKHNMQRYYERFTFGASDIPVDTGTR